MSRRKHLAVRKPCGRIARKADPELLDPLRVRRLVDASVAGLRDSLWATTLGRLHLTGKLSASEVAAGVRWASLVADYDAACQSPRPPRSAKLEPGATGQSLDPIPWPASAMRQREPTRTRHSRS